MRSRCRRARPTGGRRDVTSLRLGFGACAPEAIKAARPPRLDHRKGPLRHVAADGIEYGVATSHNLSEIFSVVIDDFIGSEAAYIFMVRRTCGRDHTGADMLGKLNGEACHSARPAVNEDCLAGLQFQRVFDST